MSHACLRGVSWHLIMAGKDSYALALVMAGASQAKGLCRNRQLPFFCPSQDWVSESCLV